MAPWKVLVRANSDTKGKGILQPPVKMEQGVTQEDPVPPTIFNIMVYTVV